MNLKLIIISILMLVSFTSFSQTFNETWNGSAGDIPDSGPETCFDIVVSGVGNLDGTTTGVTEVCLDITHTYDGDLDIYLHAPDGTIVELSTDNGGSGNDYSNTCFDMTAGTNVTAGTAPFSGSYVPEGNLNDFSTGNSADGTWQICITDDAGGDIGEINSASITFGTPPAPAVCTPDMTINGTTYSQSGLTTCGFGDDYSSADACGSSYMNGDDIVIEYTPSTSECVNIELTNTDTWTGVFLLDGCPDDGLTSCINSSTSSSGDPTLTGVNVTSGNTYYIVVSTYPSPQCTPFDIDIISCPPPPANDDCAGATSAPVNPDQSCSSIVSGTVENATASSQANGCGGTANDDVWYSFVATNTTHYIDLLNVSGSTTDLYHSVYGGTCGSIGAAISCSDPNSSTVTGLTVGNTYYVRIYSWSSSVGATSTFDLCIGSPPPPPTNDDCSSATSLTVNSDLACGTTTFGYVEGATASSQANGCGGTANDDVWYSFVATSTEHEIDLLNVSGSTTDLYHSVYSGTCGSIGAAISCSDPNSSSLTGLTVGNTYYVRVYSWSSSAGATTSFDICVGTPPPIGPCGNYQTNDYCSDPATLTQGGSSWSSSTSSIYSDDEPANVGTLFCGSIENNSWYQFTASSTTETFDFSSITNCTYGDGVQAEVYDVTTDSDGCCTNFTSMSNCYNPANTTSGTVTATGLTVGQTYYLMVDGWGGDDCDFTVTGWSATGILSVELLDFGGVASSVGNIISWSTKSERDNDYFIIERSLDGKNFEYVERIDGSGSSSNEHHYQITDDYMIPGLVYYRMIQVDLNGDENISNTITLTRKSTDEGILSVYPNPASSYIDIAINLSNSGSDNTFVTLIDQYGKVVRQMEYATNGYSILTMNTEGLASGLYYIKIENSNVRDISNQVKKVVIKK